MIIRIGGWSDDDIQAIFTFVLNKYLRTADFSEGLCMFIDGNVNRE